MQTSIRSIKRHSLCSGPSYLGICFIRTTFLSVGWTDNTFTAAESKLFAKSIVCFRKYSISYGEVCFVFKLERSSEPNCNTIESNWVFQSEDSKMNFNTSSKTPEFAKPMLQIQARFKSDLIHTFYEKQDSIRFKL